MMDYAVKIVLFGVFVALLFFAADAIIKAWLPNAQIGVLKNVIYMLHYLGIIQAINLYFSMMIANWAIDKIIRFWM